MIEHPLFRSDALEAKRAKWLGEIMLVRPMPFAWLTGCAVSCAVVLLAFLAWGSYTKRSTVAGELMPAAGLVKVYVPQAGIVLQKHVQEGLAVQRGQILYVLSSERQSRTQGETQAAISAHVLARRQSLREELEKTRLLQLDDREALRKKIADLESELSKLIGQIEGQMNRVRLAEETVMRYQGLLANDYISREQLQQKQEDLLDQRTRLQGLEREKIGLQREVNTHRGDLASQELRQHNDLARIERSIADTSEQLSESEAKRGLVIVAPEAGIATAISAEVGQAVDGSKPLMSIVPAGAHLQAQLYAPSKAVGFVKPGDAVLLRYQAFPYQKFGQARGKVVTVARTAQPVGELTGSNAAPGVLTSEPLYRITVELTSQTIHAYGQPQALQAGMLLDADIMQETRKLYEWVLEPLYSITGKL